MMMMEKPSCRLPCLLVMAIFITLILSSFPPTLHARFTGIETGVGSFSVKQLEVEEIAALQTDLMGGESCGSDGDGEECMKKRVMSESEVHLDYIYTQQQRH
ncbi:hypothetical protein MLD38_017248 [Melastoma candidum]|uniref:Uncharacterized protein n=1 Tax=Melastoma candidum TaxID=119954 RepID=A0ACB9QR62_9MYRT|nr:hypothetical protein MLD38_017248 [Melastoma candidum]